MIVLFPEFDCFRICWNITMHRPSCIDLNMLVCHEQWLAGSAERLPWSTIEQSSIGLAQISHHKGIITMITTAENHVVESYTRWATHFHMYRQFAKTFRTFSVLNMLDIMLAKSAGA